MGSIKRRLHVLAPEADSDSFTEAADSLKELSVGQLNEFLGILSDDADRKLVAWSLSDMTPTKVHWQHTFEFVDWTPISVPVRRVSRRHMKAVEEELDRMLKRISLNQPHRLGDLGSWFSLKRTANRGVLLIFDR